MLLNHVKPALPASPRWHRQQGHHNDKPNPPGNRENSIDRLHIERRVRFSGRELRAPAEQRPLKRTLQITVRRNPV